MTKIAFIFPGQGSQSVGMGAEFVSGQLECKAYYDKADDLLGYTLSKLMLEGPAEELTLTYNAQPALLTTSAMIADKLKQAGITPDYTAGHSLGEYTALVASDVLSFEDGVQAVHSRGMFMNEAVPAGEGAMAAILGLERDVLQAVTDEVTASGKVVQLANLNCPGQIVISGTKAGVDEASVKAKEAGAKRALPLVVSGPFHSELMRPAAGKLQENLQRKEMQDAQIPVISNVMAEPVTEKAKIQQLLVEQLYSPVLWEDSVRKMLDLGVDVFIECGPGKVLSGLVKKIDRQVKTYCVYDGATFEQVVEASKEWS
ncbi:ACP S-malonyltransferase [Viridibacillus sp. YIM B01967]|uniref:Malonyl CoA-acyl carrier protein transacylase n=1 Tax=Viridibacillus soli TaxID=2798301 RepID=A0ABS1H4S4_9BACL|nr:ACP S-malonyltransferase [Viridibacillus soli]MBK3494423.1 ACP S-malonyltransferase [Viridibacillus soli]